MLPKQDNYKVGMYLRLSNEDERNGESLSIDNQRKILTDYITEQGWILYDEYVDDGYSGVDFNRPGVQRMLEDAKTGKINLVLCKDLSRFGRNYIEVGRYVDYLFPLYHIRFIALTDNVDTANADSSAMDMMPIMNIFNEWHSANTSKKLRAVHAQGAKIGKYKCTFTAYGYLKGDDEKYTPVPDPQTAPIVRRIFEMYASGMKPIQICNVLNEEHIPTPTDYRAALLGKPNPFSKVHPWGNTTIKSILNNEIYIGTMANLKTSSISYKNKKRVRKEKTDWVVVKNNHEPIISQELWDKVREIEASVSRGKRDKLGEMATLSGFLYCDSCGTKMRLVGSSATYKAYVCGYHARFGKQYCSTHYIRLPLIEQYILMDIQDMIEKTADEEKAKEEFLKRKRGIADAENAADKKRMQKAISRIAELDNLIQTVYEDKVIGKIPEEVCISLLEKYQAEKKNLQAEYDELQNRLEMKEQGEKDVEEFIRRLKKYAGATELTRQMCYDLIEYVTVDENNKDDRSRPREIHIYYKLIDKELTDKSNALI